MFKPIIITALANDNQSTLKLDEEFRAINQEIWKIVKEDKVRHFASLCSEIEDLYDDVLDNQKELVVFHFAGHSDAGGIHTEDSYVLDKSLSSLLGTAPNLKLVFLNGCANQEQVKLLFEVGVPVVIATSVKVLDDQAINISKYFYKTLTNGSTIKEAFEVAKGFLANSVSKEQEGTINADRGMGAFKDAFSSRPKSKKNSFTKAGASKNKKARKVTRGGATAPSEIKEFNVPGGIPWGLYYKEESNIEVTLFDGIAPSSHTTSSINPFAATVVANAANVLDAFAATVVGTNPSNRPISQVTLSSNDSSVLVKQFPIEQNTAVVIGRHPTSHIQVHKAEVSRKHARITWQGNRVVLTDENSTNGTFWNKERIVNRTIEETGTLRLYNVVFTITINRL